MIQDNEGILTKPQDAANHMNNYYSSIANEIGNNKTTPNISASDTSAVKQCAAFHHDHPSIQNIRTHGKFPNFGFQHVNPKSVENICKELDGKKSTGYDNIPCKLLKYAASPVSHHLAAIFNQCVDTNIFPDGPKMATVTPIYKRTTT